MIYILLGILIFMVAVVIVKLRKQNEMNDYLAESLDHHILEVQSIYQQMRGIKHDYMNQLQVLKTHSQQGHIDELESYLNEMEHELNQVDTIVMSGNIVVDALVNSKLTLAKSAGITLNAKAIAPQKLPISDLDLGIIIGNIISNAYESALKTEDKTIRFYLAPIKNNLYISCTNSTVGKVRNFISQKTGHHGYGLVRVDQTVKKYDGWVVRASENNIFVCEVYIPLTP